MNAKFKVTAFHMVDNLGGGLYESVGQRLMELFRNSLLASMPNPGKWEPKRARIEVMLVPFPMPNNPPALIVLDHGCGMTEVALDRYFNWLGTPLGLLAEHSKAGYNGASQKGIGRLAALALNENCLHDETLIRVKHGYYLFSRTSASGNVRYVPVIPERVEVDGGFNTDRFISPNATELGPLRNITGSFTAIVIPTPVFKSLAEITAAVEWLLPRERDKMFDLKIGGKTILPPELASDVNLTADGGLFRARFGKSETRAGLWLCDSETGVRVADCTRMATLLPDPLGSPELIGDIFAPNLLRHQNTARSSLAKEFTRKSNKDWGRLLMFLIREVAPAAKKLVDRDTIRGAAVDTLDELTELLNERFGVPVPGGAKRRDGTKGGTSTRTSSGTPGAGGGGPPPAAPEADEDAVKKAQRRSVSVKIRDEVYQLHRGISLGPYIFAQMGDTDDNTVYLNVRGSYQALPKGKVERREHCLMNILIAIGARKFPDDQVAALAFANEVRNEILG